MKRKIDMIIVILCLASIMLMCYRPGPQKSWLWILILTIIGLVHIYLGLRTQKDSEHTRHTVDGKGCLPRSACTELILLSEEGSHLASWNIYGKNGIVIGRDVGENQVTVDLNETAYAGMIDVEHAILNFAGNNWYVEDISTGNGISIQKQDGRKYKLSYGKPCKVERFDIIFIGLTRLQIL
ncbi:MAG: FHA domain-containing protein [Lachnospiraceae bacterium]